MWRPRFAPSLCAAILLAGSAAAKTLDWTYRTNLSAGNLLMLTATDVSGTLFVIGGAATESPVSMNSTVYAYKRSTNSWTTRATLPLAMTRMAHSAVAIGSTIYVVGGRVTHVGGWLGSTTYCFAYDTRYDTVTAIAPMTVPREAAAAAVVAGKIYVFGGFNTIGGGALASVECYDTGTGLWSTKAAMAATRVGPAAAAPGNSKIYVFGGNTGGPPNVVEYNPAGDSYATRADMPTPRTGPRAVAVGPAIYVMGGDGSPPSATVERYLYGTDTWETVSSLGAGRSYPGADFHQGMIYVVGGMTTYPNATDVVEEGASGLETAGAVVPGTPGAGTMFQVTLTITATGWGVPNNVQPYIDVNTGSGIAPPAGGVFPPPPVPIPPGASAIYSWTFSATGSGTVRFTMTAIGTEAGTGKVIVERTTVQATLAAPPAQPVWITALASSARVDLSWMPAAPGTNPVSGYQVFRTTQSEVAVTSVGTVWGSTSVFADVTAVNGKPYLYRVEAFDTSVPALHGQISAEISATPFAPPGPPTPTFIVPGSNRLTVNWTAGAAGTWTTTSLHVYRRQGAGGNGEITTTLASTTYYRDNTAINGNTYTYFLIAEDSFGHLSPPGAEITATPYLLTAPGSVAAAAGNQQVIVTWNASGGGTYPLDGYMVYRGLAPGTGTLLAGPIYGTSLVDGPIANTVPYYYDVRTRDLQGHVSAPSVEAPATASDAVVNPPTGVVTAVTAADTAVSWTSAAPGDTATVGGIAQYAVLRSTCATCGYSSSVYVGGGTNAWQDVDPPRGTGYRYAVRTRSALGVESADVAGVSVSGTLLALLRASLSAAILPYPTNDPVAVTLTVTNTGINPAMNTEPVLWMSQGGALVAVLSGPSPAGGITMVPGSVRTFDWLVQAKGSGPVEFTVSITAQDMSTGAPLFGFATLTATFLTGSLPPPVVTPPATLEARVESGKALVGPNVLDHATGGGVRVALRGTAGGSVSVRIFDEAGREVRTFTVALDGQGQGVRVFDGRTAGGSPLAPGLYYLVAEGGGVSDRRTLAVRGAKR